MPVSSLESLANAWPSLDMRIIAAFDARNSEVFWARFEPKNGIMLRQTEDQLTHVDAMKASLRDDDTVIIDTLGFARAPFSHF